jgi:hypothetical protein
LPKTPKPTKHDPDERKNYAIANAKYFTATVFVGRIGFKGTYDTVECPTLEAAIAAGKELVKKHPTRGGALIYAVFGSNSMELITSVNRDGTTGFQGPTGMSKERKDAIAATMRPKNTR